MLVCFKFAKIFALGIFIISLVYRKDGLACFTISSLAVFALLYALF